MRAFYFFSGLFIFLCISSRIKMCGILSFSIRDCGTFPKNPSTVFLFQAYLKFFQKQGGNPAPVRLWSAFKKNYTQPLYRVWLNFRTLYRGNKTRKKMEIITIESKAYKSLVAKLNRIERLITEKKKERSEPDNLWLDGETVCAYLKVSKRTLQRYRSNGTIAYSIIGRKTYYSVSAIKRLLKEKNIHHDKKSLDELAEKGRIQNSSSE